MKSSRTCYVIMPFDKRYEPTYTQAIRPAFSRVEQERGEAWVCRRGDDIRVPGSIAKEIVTSLHIADIVIADLSGNNPNVFYELGVAHSSARPTIMITQDIKALPFDINAYRVHAYVDSGEGLRNLSDRLAVTVLDVLSHRETLTNPVLDFAPIRHAEIILNLDAVRQLERAVQSEVWLIQPSLDTDLKMFCEVIRDNLKRGVKYRYLLPKAAGLQRQAQRFLEKVECGPREQAHLQIRTVEPHLIESEVVIYDPFSGKEDVMIMSPREQEFVFWYRVGSRRGEDIRDRYDVLWETVAEVALGTNI